MIGAVVPSFDYALYARTTSALQRRLDASGYSLVLAEHHYDLAALALTERIADAALGRLVGALRTEERKHQDGAEYSEDGGDEQNSPLPRCAAHGYGWENS